MVSLRLVACALIIAAASTSSSLLAEARECKMKKGTHVWKHQGGSFRRVQGTLDWEEADEKGVAHTKFTEVAREHEGIIIHNPERGVNILLRSDMAAIQNKGQNSYQQLYAGKWLKTVDCTEKEKKTSKKKKGGDSDE